MTALTAEHWLARLEGVEAVVNAVGIIVERGGQTFERVHAQAPIALFTACRMRGVQRVVQISALGADTRATSYFSSKSLADDFLVSQAMTARVIRPALVYGDAGASARFFRALASLPLHLLPAGGHQPLRPIHIDDLCMIVSRLLEADDLAAYPFCIEAVGNTQVEYREMLGIYRKSLGLAPAVAINIPPWVMRWTAAACGRIPGSILTPDTWRMLQRGNTGDMRQTSQGMEKAGQAGKAPRGIENFIEADTAPALRAEAFAAWRPMMLRLALAIVWIFSALVSAALYPHDASLALLGRLGLHGHAAQVMLYGACLLDLGLGIATLVKPGRALWLIQIMTVLLYSVLIAIALPEFLIEPFGPILKNVPILALLILLLSEEAQP